jgi:hypothetical protein
MAEMTIYAKVTSAGNWSNTNNITKEDGSASMEPGAYSEKAFDWEIDFTPVLNIAYSINNVRLEVSTKVSYAKSNYNVTKVYYRTNSSDNFTESSEYKDTSFVTHTFDISYYYISPISSPIHLDGKVSVHRKKLSYGTTGYCQFVRAVVTYEPIVYPTKGEFYLTTCNNIYNSISKSYEKATPNSKDGTKYVIGNNLECCFILNPQDDSVNFISKAKISLDNGVTWNDLAKIYYY